MKNKLGIVVVSLMMCCSISLRGQSFEDFQQQIDKDFNKFEQEVHAGFNAFVEKIDREFADFLKQSFESFDVHAGVKAQPGTKPGQRPELRGGISEHNMQLSYTPPKQSISHEPRLPNIRKTEPANFEQKTLSFNYYGADVQISYDSRLNTTAITQTTPESISNYWNILSQTNYNHLTNQLDAVKTRLNLNDWGYCKLVESFAAALYPKAPSMKNLVSWFVLTRSRYKVRIGFSDNRLYLLMPSIQTLYGKAYLESGGTRYYLMEQTSAEVFTYKGDFPEADIIPDLTIQSPLNLPSDIAVKVIRFEHQGQKHQFEVPYNKNLMKFLDQVPLTEAAVYFHSAVWAGSKDAFREALLPLLQGKSGHEAVSLLLALVQQAFEYKTDQEQFGYEKFMFADELLYYRYSDCEDRSALFTWLVRELTGLSTIGLAFDGHMAAAVCLGKEAPGQSVSFQGCNYLVADPTVVNAPPGMLLPAAVGQKPEIIPIMALERSADNIWEAVRQSGGYRADRLKDVISDAAGNRYVCGYFVEKAIFGDYRLEAAHQGRNSFLVSFTPEGRVRWARSFNGNADNLAYSLAATADGDLVLAGMFRGRLQFAGGVLEAAPNADVFVARISTEGQLKWAVKAGIDKLNQEAGLMYSAAFDPQGEKFMARLFDETEDFRNFGLQVDANNNTYITGAFYATTGMNVQHGKNFDTGAGFSPATSLKAENDALIQEQYEKTIAGLFAAIRLIQINSLELPGKDVQQVFDKHNPAFVKSAPKFYAGFGGLRFMKNAGGIITIKTSDGKPVVFDKIVVHDNARIKVVTYKSGNARIEVFSGINISNGTLSYALNEVKLFKDTGDLQLGYDADNTQVKLNLRRDMLKM